MSITASMLYAYTTCPHRVYLDLFGNPAERDEISAFVELLWERGHLFEKETVEGLDIPFLNLRDASPVEREDLTLRAMEHGENLIYGGRISHGRLLGEPDLLRRSERGYVPGDIKSGAGLEGASEASDEKPKKHYAVQLSLYSEILQGIGVAGSKEAFVWDINGDEIAYDLSAPRGTRMKATIWEEYSEILAWVEEIANRSLQTMPALISACPLCWWRTHCRREIDAADDLTLLSDLGRSRREKFPPEISTVGDLAQAKLDDLIVGGKSTISGVGVKTLQAFYARAVLQKKDDPKPYFTEEIRMPDSTTELFFDIETDPFRSLCYLHGFVKRVGGDDRSEEYVAFYADEAVPEDEREAFARAWAFIQENAEAVVYYYSHYERTIWKQLGQRYPGVATEDDVAALFEEERFVDLYSDIVKPHMIWPTVSLSLKEVAKFVGFRWRDIDPSGAGSIEWFHQWVETGDPRIRQRILEYNEDDCRATRALVDALRNISTP